MLTFIQQNYYEFHISQESRDKYKFPGDLFRIAGSIIISSPKKARELAAKINEIRTKEGKSDEQVTAGQINGLGLLHEIFHYLIRRYEEDENPGVFTKILQHLKGRLGEDELEKTIKEFIKDFPPRDVYSGKITAEEYLTGTTGNKSNKEIAVEELILLHLENSNPSTRSLEELYSDKKLSENSKYLDLIDETEKFFVTEKPFGKENLPLMQFLRKPIIKNPYSIDAQLDFIREEWGVYVYEIFNARLLGGKDLIYEDVKLFIQYGGGEKGTPPVPVYKFDKDYYEQLKIKITAGEEISEVERNFYYSEPEHFTADTDWMPRVVMIAKNTYVWLDQLSKKYSREIKTLDQVPDEELDLLAGWNFNALWLIGLWERSSASKKIKHYTGNPEAVSSAYSLYDYVIAGDLGGEAAFENLKQRAWNRGIRMSSDMVPNHTGIYSKWVVEKPDYFIQRDDTPYPGYSFNGPNLSEDDRVEIRIEDKYYSKQDAAVVFQRRDAHTGTVKYIYHGNDGTNMPWNDTAQLNLLSPEVKESLIQTILHVARKTPIIRFDAAMTLAKKHFQRLWYPQPGLGGAIPSRSDFSMTNEQFQSLLPNEFWREVVDRINSELPNTLLLAEAFWLMESYFVRTLGMHRVYNSAFMHMMMKEENDKYRQLIKNTIEFNPEILKRYVNFMSNPDEETAVNQFGKGDKYFGIATLMITLPGLPMFAHGQIEGFAEKYGMEYKRAYYEEFTDQHLVWRHEQEIFPLIKMRFLFSQVDDFELFDFYDSYGNTIESVYAFTNKHNKYSAIVLFNNSYAEARGTIKFSSPKFSSGNNDTRSINLSDALSVRNDPKYFYIYKDHQSKLEHLISGNEIEKYGMYFVLQGYQSKVLLEFKEVYDEDGRYQELNVFLNGRGVPSIRQSLNELTLAPFHTSLSHVFDEKLFIEAKQNLFSSEKNKPGKILPEKLKENINRSIDEMNKIADLPRDKKEAIKSIENLSDKLSSAFSLWKKETSKKRKAAWIKSAENVIQIHKEHDQKFLYVQLILTGLLFGESEKNTKKKIDDLLFEKVLANGFDNNIKLSYEEFSLLKINLSESILNGKYKGYLESAVWARIKSSNSAKAHINLHEYKNLNFFNKESFENLLYSNLITSNFLPFKDIDAKNFVKNLRKDFEAIDSLKNIAESAGYNVEKLDDLLSRKKREKVEKTSKAADADTTEIRKVVRTKTSKNAGPKNKKSTGSKTDKKSGKNK